MRKKSFIIVLLVLVMSLSIFACAGGGNHNGGSGDYKFDDYTDFTGDDTSPKLELDEGMTLDGKLDETAWAEADNTLTATSSHSTEEEPLVMNVTTHFGEKALYFAFDVTDNTIFVNTGRRQSRNTGVELYLSSIDNFTFGNGAISVRVTPDGKGGGLIGYYVPSGNAWSETTAKGKYAAATYIDGEINSRNGAKGYTVELALSYDLIGGKTNAVQYTASFIQSRVLERDERLDNTFLKGTSYLQPGSWIGVTENSIIRGDEKYNFLDENYVVTDADMTVDGKLDDANWQTLIAEGKGKAITHKASGITLTTYVHFGENGVYIGLDSDAKEVWYNAERATKYNTGAEIFISALGNTVLSSDTAIQFRFAVGGNSLRYRANPNAVYPYTSSYVPAKIAGSVKNGGEFNKAVDTENGYNGVDGWQGEIFVPWSAFGATTPEQKSQIAVYNNLYLSKGDAAYNNDTEARADGWSYLAPAEQKVWGNGSAEVNPQKSFFRFTKNDGFVFCGVEVPDAVMLKNADGTFTATLSPRYIDAVTSSAFTTETKEIVGGTFGVPGVPEITADAFTQNEDGSFTMTVSEDAAKKLIGGKQAVFRTDDIEAYFNIEYIDVDSSRFDAGRVKAYINFNGGIDNIIGDGTTFVGRGTPELVKYGTGSAINGYYAANMKKGSVKLNETVGTGSFTMSAMVNGDDIKNYIKSETVGGYAFVIFGTGNVDGNNGFSLRVRKDTLQVKFLGQRNQHDAVLMNVSGWQRWTFLVDRETAGKLTYTLYLDNNKVIEKTISLASDVSLDVEGYNTIGIGAPGCNLDGDGTGGGYTDKSIGLDEYVYMAGTFDFKDMLDMIAWANEANVKYAFSTDNVVFDFNDVTESGYSQQLRVVAYPEDGSASVNVTDVTFGAEIVDYITRAEGADYFTLSIPADKADEFRAGVRATYTYKGVTRTFTVKYIALEKLYLDVTEISVWKKNKVGDNYVFTVRVYGDSEHNTIVTGANFGEWNGYATDKGEGVYELTVPANVVEGLSSVKNITVSKGNATAAFVNFTTNGSGANIFGATFTGLPEGVTITESISAPGTYTLNVPYAKLGELRSGVTVTATIGGVKRTFVVKYVALEKLYLDKTYVPMWLKNKSSDDTYKFNIGVYADSAHTIAVEGVTFDRWNSSVTYDSASKTYAFSAPASDVENMTSAVTVTASKGDAETAEFEFEYKYLTAAEIADVANNAEAYIDFDNGKVIDKIQNKAYVVADREAANIVDGAKYAGDKYFAANQKRTSVKLATTLGTDSFTVSMLVNGADVRKYALDDYLNGVPGAKAGYAFVLFGTGNVDGANGFTVRVRKDTVQVKVGGTSKGYSSAVSKITDNWQRWSVTFDRSTEGTVKYAIYFDGVQVVNDSVAYTGSLDVSGFNTLGIGAPGCEIDKYSYTDKSIGLDDFMFVRKALSDKQIGGLDSYYGDVLKSVGWYVDNVTFDFTDVATLPEGTPFATDVNFTTNGSGAVTTGATFTGLPEGVNISENAGVYTLTVPTDKLDEFKEAVTVTAKIGDIERKFTIKYSPLDKLYLDKTSVSMWKKEKTATDNTYKFTVGVYADSEHTIGLDGVTFDKWNDRVTYSGNGIYTFSVLASDVEALTSVQNIVASRGEGVTTAEFEFEYLYITQDEINAIANDAKAYIDFDGDVTDAIGDNASVARGTATYGDATKYEGDKYFAANQKNTSVKLATTLGTDSFTVSMLVNGADIKSYAKSGYAFVLVGTGNVDGNSGFSVRVRSNTFQVKIGSTRKDHSAQLNKITGDWQRWTMTFDRSIEGTVKYAIYLDGVQVVNDSVAYTSSLDVSGFNTLGIGAPGCNLDGDGTGGGYTNMAIGIDDFMLINRVITANEIAALDSYYTEISAIAGWKVDDVTVKFDEVTTGEDKTVNLNIVKYAAGAITTGATFTGLPEGVTISETAGVYTLTIPYEKLGDLKTGVTVTAKVGVIERTFTVKYVPLDTLYASTVNFYEYEIDGGGNVTKSVRVSADEQGTVGIAEASFDGLPTGVTYVADATAGDYVFTVPVDKINDFVAATVTVTYDGVTANVNIVYTAAILKDTEVYSNIDTVSTKSSNKQGGQVFTGIDLGTDSFTVAFMADNLNKIATGGGYVLFSTGNTDVSMGINVYANNNRFRFRCAGVSGNFQIAHNLAQYTDWTHLAFTFDRSVANKLTITAYVNYVKVGSTTQSLTTDETFTYGESKNFVVGSINGEMWAETGAMANTNQYNLSAAGVTIYRGVAPIDAVRTYFDGYLGGMTLPADALQARFTFADGTTANSVADSSVTMTKNENATETIADGKDGGTDKAIKINSKSAYYDVNGFDVSTGSFAVSMDLKMDFSTALTENGSGIVLFATTDPGSASGIAVTIRKNTFRVRINGETKFLAPNTDSYTGKWTNVTVAVVRADGKCTINVYFNHALAATSGAFSLADTVSLANSEKDGYFGIGKGVEISGSTGTDYADGAFKWYEDNTHTIDNVMLISGAMTDKNVLALRNI